jgi:hypothetical protein
LSTTNHTWTALGTNLGLCSENLYLIILTEVITFINIMVALSYRERFHDKINMIRNTINDVIWMKENRRKYA